MAWDDISVVPGEPAFAAQFNVVQANITAQANGDPGAPKNQTVSYQLNSVDQAAIGNAAVGQAQLKTSSGEVGAGVWGDPFINITLPGGQYGFYPDIRGDGTHFVHANLANELFPVFTTVYRQNISIRGGTFARQRYITASPPYSLSHGDIGLFVFLLIDSDKNIIGSYISDSPPWGYNGPTDIRPTEYRDSGNGVITKHRPVVCAHKIPLHPSEGGDPEEYIAFMANPECEIVEIDDKIKNADMGLIPHPFASSNEDHLVVLIEPTGDFADKLFEAYSSGVLVSDMLPFIEIGGVVEGYNSPDGVSIVKASWKAA